MVIINSKFLALVAETIVPVLTQFCNACFEHREFPNRIKVGKVVSGFKTGDKTKFTNYTSYNNFYFACLSNTFKKLVSTRIVDFLSHNKIISRSSLDLELII